MFSGACAAEEVKVKVKAKSGKRRYHYSIVKALGGAFEVEERHPVVDRFSGDCVERDTPVPIPNTAVKPLGADGTAPAAAWESRSSPEFNKIKSPLPSLELSGLLILALLIVDNQSLC